MPSITIDGTTLDVAEGATILDAARQAGIRIPTLCFLRERSAVASCRVCVVDVEGLDQPVPSCATPVQDGMKVTTSSPRIEAYRRIALELIIADHGLDSTNYCFSCDKNGACELQAVCREYGCLGRPTRRRRSASRCSTTTPSFPTTPTCASVASAAWARRRAQPHAGNREARRSHADRGAVRRGLARHRLRVVRQLRAGVPHGRAHREAPRDVPLVGDRARAHHVPALRRGLPAGPRGEGRRRRGRRGRAGPVEPRASVREGALRQLRLRRRVRPDTNAAREEPRDGRVRARHLGRRRSTSWRGASRSCATPTAASRWRRSPARARRTRTSTCSRRWRASCSKRTTWTVARVFDTPPRSPVWRPCSVPAR